MVGSASLLATGAPVRQPYQGGDLEARIASELAAFRDTSGFPGITVGVALPDGRALAAAAGWTDSTRRTPLQPASRMPAGSVGKTFVAAAILQAVDDRALDLDRPISTWLGGESWFDRIPNARQLTLRLLLSHRSGVPEPYESQAFVTAITTNLDKRWTAAELVAFVLGKKPRSPAGAKYFYTDMNYVIAGLTFERAAGMPLFDAIRTRIVDRFGLDQTVTADSRQLQDVAAGVLDRGDGLGAAAAGGSSMRDGAFVYNLQAEYAGGGMISTARDLARWGKILWEGRAFSEPRLADMLDGKPAEKGTRYGLGTEIIQTGAGDAYAHDGWTFGYQTQLMYLPKFKVAAAVQINSDPMKRYKLSPGHCLSRILQTVVDDLRGR